MAEKKITEKQVRKAAELSSLNLSQQEISKFSELLTDTLKYINVLEELDTSEVNETYQVTGLNNVYRDKDLKTTLSKKEALKNATQEVKGLFATKAVFDR